MNSIERKKLSPMMTHYMALKEKYPETILLYRLGDFYEMFFDDAVKASKLLDLTLTGRDCGLDERAPMCGVPYHAVDNYISRLVASGNKVAICEQLSNPSDQKGMVKRDIVRIITPGTNTNEEMLNASENHYLCSVTCVKEEYGVALLDITTGEFTAKSFLGNDIFVIEDYLLKNAPSEIIAPKDICDKSKLLTGVVSERLVRFSPYYDYAFDFESSEKIILKQFNTYGLEGLGLKNERVTVCAAGGLLDYVIGTQKRCLNHINPLKLIVDKNYMSIDYNTVKNLELLETQGDCKKVGSLLWVLDKTKTSMGARKLRNWILSPLQNIKEIDERQNVVAEFSKNVKMRTLLGSLLSKVKDIERLVTKISYCTINPRDCLALAESLKQIPMIKELLMKAKAPILLSMNASLPDLSAVWEKIDVTIVDEPPATMKDGGFIKNGCNKELDETVAFHKNIKAVLAKFESEQKVLTGVPTLKVGYNRIFGYYIEISKNKKPTSLPSDYIRKQTVANGERYINDELLRLEKEILGAADKIFTLENVVYDELCTFLSTYVSRFQNTAEIIAILDCFYSLSEVAVANKYVKPKFTKDNAITIIDGRHPVVEQLLKTNEYVPNDTILNNEGSTLVITGPNMAGKSTYIRQVALITLMAHIGSFVPAERAELYIIDKIFTRVGASDNLIKGQSTFMVEMLEVANIINNATSHSLLVLDEIGRGTSTLDGLSIAWAIVEHIVLNIKAKTLFATHYHELSELEQLLPGIRNYRILVQEKGDSIAFLYKIARGGANKSFGIEVAQIAGVDKNVILRARDILASLSDSHELSGGLKDKLTSSNKKNPVLADQFTLFSEDSRFVEIKKILNELNINRCTPIEALTILSDLKKIIDK